MTDTTDPAAVAAKYRSHARVASKFGDGLRAVELGDIASVLEAAGDEISTLKCRLLDAKSLLAAETAARCNASSALYETKNRAELYTRAWRDVEAEKTELWNQLRLAERSLREIQGKASGGSSNLLKEIYEIAGKGLPPLPEEEAA